MSHPVSPVATAFVLPRLTRSLALILILLPGMMPRAGEPSGRAEGDCDFGGDSAIRRPETRFLHQVIEVHPRVLSGARPDSDAAFAELRDLGVRTVISVDGIRPDLETARRYGLRYVHLPHGYDGVPRQRALQLAKALHEFPGTIYLHCHHGKHRSPAAAIIACVGAGLRPSVSVDEILQAAGTSPHYVGLREDAKFATPFTADQLKGVTDDLPEVTPPSPLVESMIAMETHLDDLRTLSRHGWKPPSDHPDQDATEVATLLWERWVELERHEASDRPNGFDAGSRRAMSLADDLRRCLMAHESVSGDDKRRADALVKRIADQCVDCHRVTRDGTR